MTVKMPAMGKARIIDMNQVTESTVLYRITKPDGADGIEISIKRYPSGDDDEDVATIEQREVN
jgi:hypothetical protein